MAINNRGAFDNYLVTEKYISIRSTALHFPAKALGKFADAPVYGVVIDMPMNPTLLGSLIVYANGAANLYFNNGVEYTGAAQRHQTVIQPSRMLVANAARLLDEASPAKAFPLPMNRNHYIYLLTKKGIFKREIDPMHIMHDSDAARNVYAIYQQLMHILHTARMQDQAAGNNA